MSGALPETGLDRDSLQAILDGPRMADLTREQQKTVIARNVASSLRLSGFETTEEQVLRCLARDRA